MAVPSPDVSEVDVTAALTEADAALRAGDVPGALARLRPIADEAPLAALAGIVEQAATAVGFDDMARAAQAVAADERNPQALYDFGYAAIERGISYLAVPALVAALRAAPGSLEVLSELVAALGSESRHGEAVRWLEEHDTLLRMWPDRYLLVFNSAMAGDIERATRYFAQLTEPDDANWTAAYERVQLIIRRFSVLQGVSPLHHKDLRGWHFALNGGVLGTLSPYGFPVMTGRWAFTQDSPGRCRYGLERLRVVLDAVGRRPRAVSVLPDRSSQILGLAAAQVLDVPAEPWVPGRADTVVVAYDLREVDPQIMEQLGQRDGQTLVEHATCWTELLPITADYTTLLAQHNVAPWHARLWMPPGSDTPQQTDPDDRPAEVLAAEILSADTIPDSGDGESPPDPDDGLAAFVSAVREFWPPASTRHDMLLSPGPVGSNRFV